ncbi:Uncharacterised protein [Mobiluncus curtisii subsp. curtisii]|nr:Uncharacterised protein [Mobiluncus curtisii subsp. curtisii]
MKRVFKLALEEFSNATIPCYQAKMLALEAKIHAHSLYQIERGNGAGNRGLLRRSG